MTQMSGADADALDRLGVRLERAGGRLRNTRTRLQRGLNSAPWSGRNADRFRHEFNTVHARAIADAAAFLDDAYETLLRNAEEQRRASGSARRSWSDRVRLELQRSAYWIARFPWSGSLPALLPIPWRLPMPSIFPWVTQGWLLPPWRPRFSAPDIRPIDPPEWLDDVLIGLLVGGVPGAVGGFIHRSRSPTPVPALPGNSPSATRPPSAQPAPAPATPSLPTPPRSGDTVGVLRGPISDEAAQAIHDKYQPGLSRGFQYQCVAWAKARWIEQGVPADSIRPGNGWQLAGNNGGSPSTPPTLGAMASYGTAADFGHVMIVEEIATGPNGELRIRVSEMNTGSDGSTGDIGSPAEYRDDRWWTKQPDGTWRRDQQSNGSKVITFASKP